MTRRKEIKMGVSLLEFFLKTFRMSGPVQFAELVKMNFLLNRRKRILIDG
jgi:hypothetical protein